MRFSWAQRWLVFLTWWWGEKSFPRVRWPELVESLTVGDEVATTGQEWLDVCQEVSGEADLRGDQVYRPTCGGSGCQGAIVVVTALLARLLAKNGRGG